MEQEMMVFIDIINIREDKTRPGPTLTLFQRLYLRN